MSGVRVISYSELDTYRQCPHKHRLGYVERWTKPQKGGALARGTWWHTLLEAHYNAIKEGQAGSGVTHALVAERTEPVFEAMYDAEFEDVGLIQWMYQGHLDLYGLDPEWTILAVEHQAIVPLLTGTGRKSLFRLKTKIDLIVRDRRDRIWLVDHKSCQNLPSQRDLDFDDQFGMYVKAMRQIGKPVFGSIYSAARTQRNKTGVQTVESRFSRTLLTRGDLELDKIGQETLDSARQAYSARNAGERHPNSDTCKWKCDFAEACLMGRKTGSDEREREFLRDTGFAQDFTRH